MKNSCQPGWEGTDMAPQETRGERKLWKVIEEEAGSNYPLYSTKFHLERVQNNWLWFTESHWKQDNMGCNVKGLLASSKITINIYFIYKTALMLKAKQRHKKKFNISELLIHYIFRLSLNHFQLLVFVSILQNPCSISSCSLPRTPTALHI